MTVWRGAQPLVLASQSAVRIALLANAGIAVEAIPAGLDERDVQRRSGLTHPADIAALLAGEKARAVSQRHPGRIVIGADQTLALGDALFSKPEDRAAAAVQIARLAGRTHALHSAVSVMVNGAPQFAHVGVARMTMRALTAQQIEAYLDAAGENVTASVGAYQLEKTGVHLFERIEGDHFTILGLPLLPLLGFLRSRGLLTV